MSVPATLEATRTYELPNEPIYDIGSLGQGYALKSSTTVELTKDYAEKFLDQYANFTVGDEKVDRQLQEKHVEHLAREMLKGTFLWEQVQLVVCGLDDRNYRMNGQHTAWAMLFAVENGLKPQRTPVRLLRYEAKTIQDMRRLYASIDRGKSRNNGNVVVSYLAGTDEFPGYAKGVLRTMASAVGLWLWESREQRAMHPADDRAFLLLKDHKKVAKQVGEFINNSKPSEAKHIRRAPVVAAMFATFGKAPQIALDFWTNVRDGLNMQNKDNPQHILRNYLLTTSMTGGGTVNDGDTRFGTSEEIYRCCLHCWNAFRVGKSIKMLKPSTFTSRQEPK